ncbi:hypothetical protein [Krasilnikovia sp. MM14-A1259]|uniref:hypothetical protein n=1 Tax=Krasilnikovia sp. MM14-A1259 TaxID=3373539 RepID=UPI00381D794D
MLRDPNQLNIKAAQARRTDGEPSCRARQWLLRMSWPIEEIIVSDLPPHPFYRSFLPKLMLVSFVIAALLLAMGGSAWHEAGPDEYAYWFLAGAGVALGCFVVLFALHFLAWVLLEHELWREGQRAQGHDDRRDG